MTDDSELPEEDSKIPVDGMDETEAKYIDNAEKFLPEIQRLERQSLEALEAAKRICEQHGIVHAFGVTDLYNVYTPESFFKIWGHGSFQTETTRNALYDSGLAVPSEYAGWETSALC